MSELKTMSEAREIIARLAEAEGQKVFAKEVRMCMWDHRSDVQAARHPDFKHRPLEAKPQPREYEKKGRDSSVSVFLTSGGERISINWPLRSVLELKK